MLFGMARPTKTEVRDLLRDLTDHLGALKDSITANNGPAVVFSLEHAEETLDLARDLLEDRYDEAFTEIEGEIVEEGELEEEELES